VELLDWEGVTNGDLGFIDIGVTGNNPPFSYSWSNGFTQQDIFFLVANTYTVTVTDALGCSSVHSFDIPVCNSNFPLNVTALNSQITPPTDQNTADGAIGISVIGGTPPYTFVWTDEQQNVIGNTKDIMGLGWGEYCVQVSDACNNSSMFCKKLRSCPDYTGVDLGVTDFCQNPQDENPSTISFEHYSTSLFGYDEYETGFFQLNWSTGDYGILKLKKTSSVYIKDYTLSGTAEITIPNGPGEYFLTVIDPLGCETETNVNITGGIIDYLSPYRGIGEETSFPNEVNALRDIGIEPVIDFLACSTCGSFDGNVDVNQGCNPEDHGIGITFEPNSAPLSNPCQAGGAIIGNGNFSLTVLPNTVATFYPGTNTCGCLFPPGSVQLPANSVDRLGHIFVEFECGGFTGNQFSSTFGDYECPDYCNECFIEPIDLNYTCRFNLICVDDGLPVSEEIFGEYNRCKIVATIPDPDGNGQSGYVLWGEYEYCSFAPCELRPIRECVEEYGDDDHTTPDCYFDWAADLDSDSNELEYCPCQPEDPYPQAISVPDNYMDNLVENGNSISSLVTDLDLSIQVQPNPFLDHFDLLIYSSEDGEHTVQIYDLYGNLLINEKVIVSDGVSLNRLNLPSIAPNGIYQLVVQDNLGNREGKLIVQMRK
jgi:hypothetical protein